MIVNVFGSYRGLLDHLGSGLFVPCPSAPLWTVWDTIILYPSRKTVWDTIMLYPSRNTGILYETTFPLKNCLTSFA